MRFTDTPVKTYEKYAHERASHSPDAFKRLEPREGRIFNSFIVRKHGGSK